MSDTTIVRDWHEAMYLWLDKLEDPASSEETKEEARSEIISIGLLADQVSESGWTSESELKWEQQRERCGWNYRRVAAGMPKPERRDPEQERSDREYFESLEPEFRKLNFPISCRLHVPGRVPGHVTLFEYIAPGVWKGIDDCGDVIVQSKHLSNPTL